MSVWWNLFFFNYHSSIGAASFVSVFASLDNCYWSFIIPQWMSVMGVHMRAGARSTDFPQKKKRSHKKTKDVCGHVSVTDTFNILLLPSDQLAWSYLCDARCSDKHRMPGQFYRSCYGDSLQTKHTHQEIHTQATFEACQVHQTDRRGIPIKTASDSPKYLCSSPDFPWSYDVIYTSHS